MKNGYLSQLFEKSVLSKEFTSTKWFSRMFFLTFGVLLHLGFLNAQTTYTWSGGPSGAWNVSTNWTPTRSVLDPNDLMVVNAGGAVTITAVPTEQVSRLVVSGNTNLTLQGAAAVTLTVRNGAAANDLEIQNGSSLTLGTNVSLTMAGGSHAQINSGGTLTISSGRTFTLTNILGTTAVVDGTMNIDGILTVGAVAALTVNGTVTNTANSGAVGTTAVNTSFSATGIYRHQRAGGNFIIATWHPDSEVFVEIPASAAANIAQANGQTFGKFTWNSPAMTNTQSLGLSSTTNFNTSFTVLSTGTGIMSFAAAAATVNINTDLNINGTSAVRMNSGGAVVTTMNLTGNLNIASTATFERGAASSLQVLNFANTSSPQSINNSGASFNPNGISINVNLGAEVNLTNSISGYNSGTFTVNGRLNMGSHVLSGTGGIFTLANATTAFLSIGHPQGISTTGATGNVQVTGTRTYGAAANYIYNGTTAQLTGNGLTTAINAASQLMIDNPVSVELQVSPTINGTLNMNQGRLILGNFNLTFVAATNFIGAPFSASKMIVTNGTGQLLVPFTTGANAPFLFPIGDGAGNYTPCTVEFTANSTARTLGARVSNTVHPFNNAATPHLTRQWLFTNSSTGTATVNASFTYVPADVVGVEANLRFNKFNSSTGNWFENTSTILASNTFSVSDESNFINPALATAFDITARANTGLFYRSTSSGNWNALATWETGPTASGPWAAASVIPNNTNSDGIEIRNGHNVTVNVAISADEITVNGTLTIASGITLTIPAGGTFGAVVNGTVINGNAATIGTITPTGGLVFNAGSLYEHARPAGTIPAATWDDNATCLVTGATGAVPAGLSPTGGFGNFTWNCAGQTTILVTGAMTCRGNFRVENTNNQILSLIGGTSGATLTINGNFEMIGGLYYAKTGTSGTATINVGGNFDMQGGTFSLAQNASSGSGVLNLTGNLELMAGTFDLSLSTSTGIGTVNLLGNYIQNGGTFTSTGTTTGISVLNLNGSATQYNYISGTINNTRINYAVNAATAVVTLNADIALSPSRNFAVIAGGTLFCQNFVISGGSANTFSIGAGSTLGIGSPDGITTAGNPIGNIQTTTRTFLTTSNYIYNGTAAQVTGNALPATVNSLTIDNAAGVTLTSSITSITSAINLNNGLLRLGASNNLSITLGNNAVVNGTPSATTMVVADGSGQFVKGFAAGFSGSFTYPIGDASGPSNTVEYSPVTINFASAPAMAAQNIGVRVVDGDAPSLGTPTDFLSRHWVFTGGGAASFDLSFQYPSDDINGTESNLRISRFLSGNWLSSPSVASGNILSNTTILTNISTPLATTTIYTGRESNQLYYRSVNSGNWADVNTWETDTDPNFSSPTSPAAAAPSFTNSVTTTISAGDEVVIDGAAINNYTPVLYVYGTLINQTSGTVIPNANGSNFFYANAEYRHDRDGGPVMTATWDPASLLHITGITSNTTGAALSNIGATGRQFGKFRYNSPGQTAANVNFFMNGTTFNGTFEIANTGGGSNAVSFGAGATTTVTLRDSLKITGGTLNHNGSGTSTTTLQLWGDYFQSGGTYQRGNTGTAHIFNFQGDGSTMRYFTRTGGTLDLTGFSQLNVVANGVVTLNSDIVIPTSCTFSVNTNGQLYMQDKIISGAGTFTVASAANTLTTLGIGHPQGISTLAGTGNIQTTTRTIVAGHRGHFIYNGTVNQVTGNLLPVAPASEGGITIDNPTTVTLTNTLTGIGSRGLTINQGTLDMAANSITVPSSLNLNSGRIIVNNGNLTLSNTNNLTALTGGPFDENTMIVINGTGQLIKNFGSGAQAEFVYPVGEINGTPEYTPVSIEFTALTTGKNVGVRVIQAMQPNELASNPAYLNRYWAFTTNNTTANTAIMRMNYKDADVVGNEADLRLAQFFNGTWTEMNSTVDVTNNILTTTAINPLLPLVVVSTPTADYTGRSNIPLHYRTVASGNWNNLAIWEVSSDPAFISPAPVPATAIPNNLNSNIIWIRNGHNVTMNVNTTADDLLVDGTLTIATGVIFTLANGPAAPDMVVNGTVINQSVATHVYTGTLVYNSGSTYRHAANGGVVPVPAQVTYNPASTFEVTGITNGTAITNMGLNGQSYGNYTWNCASQSTATFNLAFAATVTINGNFRVQNTNGQAIAIHSGTASTTVVNGDLLIQNGNLILNATGSAVTTLNLFGNYNQTGGSFQSGGSTGIHLFNMNGTNRTYSQTGGTVNNVRTNYAVNLAGADVTFNSPLTLDASRTFAVVAGATARLGANINFANAGSMTVNGTLMCGPNLVTNTTGATTFTLASGGTLGIGSPDGITTTGAVGNIQVSGTRTYNTAANYIYTGTTAQVSGNGLPATVNTLTIDNTAGGNNGVTLTNNVAVTVALNLNQGLLLLDNFNLTLSNTNNSLAIGGNTPNANNMVVTNGTGQLIKTYANNPISFTSFTFPVGDITGTREYSPVVLTTGVNSGNTIGVRVINTAHPDVTPSSNYLNRHWAFTTNIATYTYTADFHFTAADVVGTLANINGALRNNTVPAWWGYSSTNSGNVLSITTAPLNQVSAPLNNNQWTGRETVNTFFYRSVAWGNWSDPATWEISTDNVSNWVPATTFPNADNSLGILIRNNHRVTLDVNVDVDQLSFDATDNSTLIINPGVTMTVKDGPSNDLTLTANARLLVNGTIINEGQIINSAATTTFFNANANYEHKQDGGLVPISTWDATATLLLSSFVNTNPTGLGAPAGGFGNITYNCPTQTGDLNLGLGSTTIKGDLNVISTGTGRVVFSSSAITTNINGNFNLSGGSFGIIGYASGTGASVLNLTGNYNQTGGNFAPILGTGTGVQTMNFVAGPNRTYTLSGGTFSTDGMMNFVVNLNAELTLNTGINLGSPTAARSFTNNGTLWLGNNIIEGGANTTFVNTSAATATLGVGHPQGIALVADGAVGNIRTATRTYGAAANYVFYGTAANTGSGFTAATTVTFNGVTANLSVPATITGTTGALNLTNSRVLLGNNDLTFSNAAHTFIGTAYSDANMIVTNGTGRLIKAQPVIGSLTTVLFPVGTFDATDGFEYSPVSIDFNSASAAGSLASRVIKGAHPDINNPSASSDFLNRWWRFDVISGITAFSINQDGLKAFYKDTDVTGNENLLSVTRWNADWFPFLSNVDATNNVLSTPNAGTITNSTANFVLNGLEFTGRNTALSYHYRSVTNGNWNDPATWEISTAADFLNPPPVSATTIGLAPNAGNSLSINIVGGHQVTVTADVTADQLVIDNNAGNSRLIINSGVVFTLADGPGNDLNFVGGNSRLNVNGTLRNFGQINGSTAATTNFFANSLYEHKQNGGVIPTATWNTSSTCLLEDITANVPTGLNNAFGNFTWNNAGQAINLFLNGTLTNVTGNLNISNTGTPTASTLSLGTSYTLNIGGNFNISNGSHLILSNGVTTASATININAGDLNISGANTIVDFRNTVSSSGSETINLFGNYNQTGGTVTRSGVSTTTGTANIVFIAGPNRNFIQSGGAFNTNGLFNFTVNTGAELTLNNSINLGTPPSGTRTFTNSGTLWMGPHIIEGGANTSFVNTSAATVTLGVGHPQGIALVADGAVGNIQTGTTRTYGAAANYVYNGSVAQITGSGLHNAAPGTNTCTNLTINNPAGVTMNRVGGISLNIGVSGTLTLTNGNFNIGGSTGNVNTLALNGPAISPLASTALQSNTFSNLWFGPGTGNTNPDLYIPTSITALNELRLNIAGINTVQQNSNIELHGSPTGLTLTSGRLILQGANNLTALSTATNAIVGGAVNSMVVTNGTGYLRRAIPGGIATATDYIFPIGEITGVVEYSPANLRFISTSATPAVRLIGANVVNTQHPSDGTASDHFTRYWRFIDSEAGNGTYSYTGIGTGGVNMLSGVAADVVGTYANIRLNRWSGTAWTQYNNIAGTPNLSFAVQTETTAPLHNGEFTGRVNAAQPYVWQPLTGSHDFQDANNWSPIRVSPQPTDILLFNNGGTSTANNVPTQTVGQVAVTGNTNITFEAAALPAGAKIFTISGPTSTTNFTLASGSTFTMDGAVQLSLTMTGAANQAATIAGTFNINDNGSQQHTLITSGVASNVFTVSGTLNNNGGAITSAAASNLVFAAGGTYNHNRNGGNIPNSVGAPFATWNNTSNCNITGITITNPATFQGTFGNLTWNNAGQTAATGAITAAITVNGNLNVNNGLLWDNGLIITGNASGTFSVANGATYRTTRTTTLPLLPSFTGANVSLAPNSTILFAGTTAHNIPNNPTTVGTMTNYGIIALEGAVAKTLTTNINVQGITINTSGATLADGGFVITGPGVGSGTFNMVNGAIFTTTNTNTNPMPVFQTYSFGATSVVNFNALTTNQNIRNIPSPGYGIVNVIANSGVKSLVGQTFAQGTVTINGTGGNTTLDLNGHNLRLAGATPISVVAGAVLTANTAGSTLTLEGSVSQTLTISGTITGGVINQLTAANPVATVIGTTPAIFTFNNITVNTGALLNMNGRTVNLNALLTNNGEINGSAAASIFALTGSAAQNFNIGNYTSNTLGGLIVNNAAGATLTAPLNVTTLTLTNGLLTTSNTNLITVLGTGVANVVGGSTSSYVNGPIARTLPVNLTAAATYNWPVGKAEYQLFQLINPTTANAAGNVVIKVEVFDAPTGGTAGLGVSSLLTDHRWEALITDNAANLSSAGRTALTENGLTNLVHHISRSATATGTYNLIGSSYTSPVLSMNIVPDNLLGYYMIANNGGTISGPITVGTGGMVPSITNGGGLFDVINNSTVVGNVTASIISDLVNETGLIVLNEWVEAPAASNFTVRIQPNSATARLITNNANLGTGLPLIPINGADRLTIDGQHNNDGNRWLTFRHTNSTAGNTGATIRFLNNSVNNTVRNLILENNNTNTGRGVVEFTTGDNANNAVLNNEIRSSTGATLGGYSVGVLSNSAGNMNLTISGNHFYQTQPVAVAQTAISITAASSGHTISNNFIGGSALNAGGAAWQNTGNVAFNGIVLPTGTTTLNTISGNTIRNISLSGTGASSFTGINAGNGLFEITNNTIGNPSNANDISVAGTGVTTGIVVASTNTTPITGNTIANLTASGTGTGVRVIGINTSAAGNYSIEQNTISNLTSATTNTGTNVNAAIIGILNTATGTGTITVGRNTISGLTSTAPSAAVSVTGIVNSTGANASTVTRNFVHSFSTQSATSRQTGILALNGLFFTNNMVRLGIDVNGNSQTTPASIIGIEKFSSNFITFYHNSVYIGGTNVAAGTNNTFAFLRSGGPSSGSDNIRNNIFVNERSNAVSGSNRHFAIVSDNTSNLIVDYNIYFNGNGTNAVFGSNNGGTTVRNGLPLWFIGNGPHSDANSGIGNPNFIAPTAATPNLRLNAATPAEGTGVLIAGITVDFDGDDRTTNTPTDIGADAGNFNSPLVPGTDIFAPVISFSPIPNQLGCSGPFTAPSLTATVTDLGVGVPTSGANVPRLWYRRSAPTPSAWVSVPGTLISGNGNNGDWEFQVDYSLIPVTPTAGDIYQYYVAAQDLAVNNGNPNIGFSPFNANAEPVHTNNNVNTQLTAPVAPTVFVLSNPLDGTVYVGTGPGTPAYPTFNGPGGLFEAINQNGLDGNLTVIVQNTSITEPAGAPTQLNEVNECSGGPFTITIRPGSATDHTITGNITGPGLISLNGADRIIIDGSIAGSGRWLTFVNTNASSAVVHMANNATDNQVRNTVLRATNTSTSSGIVHVAGATTAGPGNSNLVFHDNAIGGTGLSNNCMLFDGSAIAPNSDITITDNHIFNYGSTSYSQGISNIGASGDNWTVTGNSIYHTVNPSVLLVAIYFPLVNGIPINNLNISNNFIGGNAPGANGLMTNSVNSTEAYGIFVNAGTTTINNNTIRNITYSNVSNSAFVCIDIHGNTQATVNGNNFDEITVLGNVAQQGYIFGIRSNTSGSLTALNNNIGYLSCLGASTLGNGSYVRGIEHNGSGTFNISNNFFLGLQNTAIATGQSSFAIRVINNSLPGEVSGNNISDNTIYGPWILAVTTANTGGYRNRGISVSGRYSGTISKNRIFDMYNFSRVYGTIGIELLSNDVGTWTVSNNQIAFGDFTVVASPNAANHIRGVKYGIVDQMNAGSTLNIFYNSVHIEGTEDSNNNSAAFWRLANTSAATLNMRNNIFINSRSGGTGLHNTLTAAGTAASSGWNSDHNFLANRNFNNVGNWLGLEYSFAGWQANSGGDANSTTAISVLSGNSSPTSLRASELFINKGSNLLLAGPGPADPFPHAFIAGLGTPVSITDDFNGTTRSALAPPSGPTMGVNEIIICSGTPPVANVISDNNNLCGVDNATLTLTGLGLTVGLTYQWFESTTSITGPWTPITGANSINYLASGVNQTTWYYADVTCTNSSITTSSNAFELTVIQNTLVATINGTNTVNVCSGTLVNLEASGAGSYSWSSNPIGFTSNSANPTASPLITTSYTVIGNISGCNFSETVTAIVFTVTVNPISTTINTGDNVTITATPSGNTGLVEYLWTPCTNLDTYSGNTVVADPEGSKTYSVFAYDQAGCTATATSNVNVFDPSIIPPPPSTVSAGYVGSNNPNTYSSIVGLGGSTVIASGNIDDDNYTNISFPAGFNFQFVGNTYTSFGINSNGFIWFGSGTPAANASTPISTTGNLGGSGTIDGVISGLGTDLWSKSVLISTPTTAQIVMHVSGTAPNRIVTIEWAGFTQKPLSRTATFFGSDRSRIDFQIRLHENGGSNSNVIDFRYRNQSSWAIFDYMENMQIGLRGATNTDFVNRTANAGAWPSSNAGSSNASVCNMTDPLGFGTYINNNNTSFRFTPTSCLIVTTLTPSGPTDLCSSATVDLTSALGSSYTWYKDGVLLVGETSQTLSNISADGLYMAVPIIGGCQGPSYVVEVKNHATTSPAVNVSSLPLMPLCNDNEATFNAAPTDGGCSPIYQWKKNGVDVGLPGSSYFDDNLVNGDQIEVQMVSSAFCATPSTVQSLIFNVAIQQPGIWLGNGTDWDTPTNWGCGIVPNVTSDVIIPTNPEMGNVFPEVSSNNTSVVRNLLIQNAASVTINAGADLSVFGNLTNNGVASLGAGNVRMRANVTQVIDGTTVSSFGNLTIDNNSPVAPSLRLDSDVNIGGNLTFIQGKVDLNGNDIDLLGTGQLVNESNNNRVYGFPGEIKTVVDMAANTNYTNIGGMGVSINTGATAPGITNVERGHEQFTHAGSYQSIRRYFDISPTVNTGLDATLRIFYFDDEMQVDVGFPPHVKANLLPWRSTDNGITWEGQFQPSNLSNDVVNNWVQLTSIPAFSRWTLSDWIDNPLPVQLLSFNAVANYTNQTVDLSWITASEINNAFFTVERSANAQNFQPVLTRPGAGNSNQVITYNDVDMNPLMGVSYYRLKQTDFDGTSTYSEIVPVMFSAQVAETVTAFVSDRTGINILYTANASGPLVVRLFDSKGAIIGNYQFNAHKGQNTFRIDGLNLATGIYMLNITNGRAQFSNKLFMR